MYCTEVFCKRRTFLVLLLANLCLSACTTKESTHVPIVELKQDGENYMLYRHGEPYYIKGAAGHENMAKVALLGGNSVRTWNTKEAASILDCAASYGLTVTLGLEVGNEWWGDDFSYMDFQAVDLRIAALRKVVEQHKDHPALLMWGVGNEVHLFGGNQLMVLYTINRIAKMIHETDPDHPVMTTMPMDGGFKRRGIMRLLCPDIDILGVNGFARLSSLSREINGLLGWNKAYILSEWGPPGPWSVSATEWGAPIEWSSSAKAWYVENIHHVIKEDTSKFLGGYAFYWGTKYERTHTFYSLFSEEGLETESVKIIGQLWSGVNPKNAAPRIDSLFIHSTAKQTNIYLRAGSIHQARVIAQDPDNDSLFYRWEIRPEGTDNFKKGNFDHTIARLLSDVNCDLIRFQSPEEEGGYRIFVYVYDNQQHIATHNLPFYVALQ